MDVSYKIFTLLYPLIFEVLFTQQSILGFLKLRSLLPWNLFLDHFIRNQIISISHFLNRLMGFRLHSSYRKVVELIYYVIHIPYWKESNNLILIIQIRLFLQKLNHFLRENIYGLNFLRWNHYFGVIKVSVNFIFNGHYSTTFPYSYNFRTRDHTKRFW